ncbi:MAG: phosphoribosylformylglycinamidine cyclo-ligase, partial [Planctomycetota bacterium]|nr:phosphoribosylformylglycinamidine cyclo-ligase [Planctomycetota bacterium]
MSSSYKSAGVDLEKYEESMSRLPTHLQKTFSSRVIQNPGGFAGLFRLQSEDSSYEDPVLVSGTDGVGTKLKIASLMDKHDTIGIDLVAMCVNDVICCGAEPLFFLDYVAMGKDDPGRLEKIVSGISEGCQTAGCALIGGETAIMPGMYSEDDYDVAGFCVGVVDKADLLDGSRIQAGDVLLGITSSGIHSNGYSLVRKIVFEEAKLKIDSHVEETGETVGDLLLKPTLIYSGLVNAIRNAPNLKQDLHGIAHITGGGLDENVSRILPPGTEAIVKPNSWIVP